MIMKTVGALYGVRTHPW